MKAWHEVRRPNGKGKRVGSASRRMKRIRITTPISVGLQSLRFVGEYFEFFKGRGKLERQQLEKGVGKARGGTKEGGTKTTLPGHYVRTIVERGGEEKGAECRYRNKHQGRNEITI